MRGKIREVATAAASTVSQVTTFPCGVTLPFLNLTPDESDRTMIYRLFRRAAESVPALSIATAAQIRSAMIPQFFFLAGGDPIRSSNLKLPKLAKLEA